MKKNLLLSSFLLFFFASLQAQVTAPDFTATDCNGVSHNLYSTLNTGKVIVLDWVMPCGACVGPSLTAYNIVQSYTSGNVLHYLIDDAGNTSCSTLSGWATNNGIGNNRTTFSTSAIVENNYGGTGMPHIVVVGPNHTIYFNGFNSGAGNATSIQNAINSALSSTGVFEPQISGINLTALADPKSHSLLVSFSLKESALVSLQMINELGEVIQSKELGNLTTGLYNNQLDLNGKAKGVYFLRLISGRDTKTIRFSIAE